MFSKSPHHHITESPNPSPSSWLARNIVWIMLAVGGAALLIIVGCCGGFFWLVSLSFRSDAPVELALQRVRLDAVVMQRLGEPVEVGWLVVGSVHADAATLRVPIRGPLSGAEMSLAAAKTHGEWQLTSLSVKLKGEQDAHVIMAEPDQPITMPPNDSGGDP